MAEGGGGIALAVRIVTEAKAAAAEVEAFEGKVSKMSRVGAAAGKVLAVGLAAAGFAALKCVEAGTALQTNQNSLNDSAKKVAGATDEQVKAMDEWADAQGRAKGVTSGDLLPSLTKLVNATHNVKQAQVDETLAMDISAKTHKSLDSVTQALSKSISTGSVTALGKYQVATKDANGHTLTAKQVMQELADTYSGSAAKAADTAAGKQRVLAVETEQLREKIGTGLLPVEGKLVGILSSVVGAMGNHTTATLATIGAIFALLAIVKAVSAAQAIWSAATAVATAAQGVWNAVTGLGNTTLGTRIGVMAIDFAAWVRSTAATVASTVATAANTVAVQAWSIAVKAGAAAQWLLNAAMDANPVTLIVIGIIALVAALVLAYKRSETFRNIVNGAFGDVQKAVGAVIGFIRDHWKLLFVLVTGVVGIAVLLIAKHWDSIKAGAAAVIDYVRGKWPAVKAIITGPFDAAKTVVGRAWDAITSGFSKAKDKLSSIGSAVQSTVVGVFQAIAGAVQSVIDKVDSVLSKLADLKSKAGGLLHDVTGGLLGRTSASTTGNGPYVNPRVANSGAPVVVNINLHGPGDDAETARKLVRLLRRYGVNVQGLPS